MDAMLEASVLYNPRCAGLNGMRLSQGRERLVMQRIHEKKKYTYIYKAYVYICSPGPATPCPEIAARRGGRHTAVAVGALPATEDGGLEEGVHGSSPFFPRSSPSTVRLHRRIRSRGVGGEFI